MLERIDQEQPDFVLLAGYHNPKRAGGDTGDEVAAQWQEGLASTLSQIDGPRVAVMREVPHQRSAPTHCLAKNPEAADRCAAPQDAAFEDSLNRAEDAALADAGPRARRVDLTEYFCNYETCPAIIGSTVVFRDDHHLTSTFSLQMTAPMWEEIRAAGGVSGAGIDRQLALAVRYRAEWAPVPPRARPSDQKEHHSWPEGCWSRARAEPPPR